MRSEDARRGAAAFVYNDEIHLNLFIFAHNILEAKLMN